VATSPTGTKPNRTAVEAQALAILRQLISELFNSRGLEELTTRGVAAHLERELGLGSLERVELMLRLGDASGAPLPDNVVADAETVQDLIDAMLGQGTVPESSLLGAAAIPAEIGSAQPARRADLEDKVRNAETLTEILRLRGQGDPARAHIQLHEQDDRWRTITFGDLYNRASGVGAGLLRRGLEPGQTVALMLPTCAEFFYVFAGILLAGGIPVPIYPPFRADRIDEYAMRQSNILRNAEVRFLVTFREAENLARLLQPRVPTLQEVLNVKRFAAAREAGAVQDLSRAAHSGDIAFLQYTSGSTGDPKGVVLTHANLLANIHSIVAAVDFQQKDVAVSWLPLYHDMGLIGAWFVPLFSGSPLVVMSPLAFLSRPQRWLWAIHQHGGTMSPAPNFAFELCARKIADKDLQGLNLSSWRAAFNGAEAVRAETIERFVDRFAPFGFRREALLPVYGLAEASLAVSAPKIGSGYKVERIDRNKIESEGRAVLAAPGDVSALEFVNAGRPLPNVEVKIVTKDGGDAGERVEGHLWFRGPSATSGYYRNPAATRELMRGDGWLDSGDLAYLADGEVYITGRAKDVIIKAGRNLYPDEIEDIAGRVAGVRTGCVVAFGAPDPRTGTERLIVAAEVRGLADEKRIPAEISGAVDKAIGLPPDHVEIIPAHSIPKTSSGKLRRSETRRLFLEGRLGRKLAPVWLQIAKLALRGALPRTWKGVNRIAKRAIASAYGVYALAVFTFTLIPVWLLVSITRDQQRAGRLIRSGSRWMLFLAGVPVRIEGGEILTDLKEKGPWVFASNHSSYVDIFVILAVLPAGVRFVAKGEVLAMPFFGTMTRRSGQLAFDRANPEARIRQARELNAVLRRGESVVVYPEGTFTRAGGIRPFQLGAFKAAVETQRPICPIAVRGARQILRDERYLPNPGRVTVTLGPLVVPNPATENDWHEIVQLRDATRQIVSRCSGEPLL